MPTETSAVTDIDAPSAAVIQTPPSDPPRPASVPANHGVAFAVREPMMCEICQKPTTKWLSYKPEAKTCICWDCGIERQNRMMRGSKG